MTRQAAFAEALFTPERPAPQATSAPGGGPVGVRFDVYRNNVTVSLTEALAEGFPVIAQLVGEQFFTAMAREFIRDHPPSSPLMTFYGAEFAAWLQDFPPVSALPYLPEVARLEYARREAYHAKDATPLDPQSLSGLSPEALDALQLLPHPAVRVIHTIHPALSIWARNVGAADLVEAPTGEVLIARPALELRICAAPMGTAEVLSALGKGVPLGRAFPPKIDAPAIFACLFSVGALIPKEI
ncbi:HvfC/BufC N-terminal domain-containing protein [Celeribacter sp. ULVN23_4]